MKNIKQKAMFQSTITLHLCFAKLDDKQTYTIYVGLKSARRGKHCLTQTTWLCVSLHWLTHLLRVFVSISACHRVRFLLQPAAFSLNSMISATQPCMQCNCFPRAHRPRIRQIRSAHHSSSINRFGLFSVQSAQASAASS